MDEFTEWGGRIISRSATRNEPMRDGTPRLHKGYVTRVCTIGPDGGMKRYWLGPVCATEAESLAWTPPVPETLGLPKRACNLGSQDATMERHKAEGIARGLGLDVTVTPFDGQNAWVLTSAGEWIATGIFYDEGDLEGWAERLLRQHGKSQPVAA